MGKSEQAIWRGRFKNFGPILGRWVDLIQRSARHWADDDCPWWYRERPLVGILGSACCYEGGSSMLEFAGEKAKEDGNPYKGRYDLLVSLKGRHYLIEAKFLYSDCRKNKPRLKQDIESRLKRALADVKKVKYSGTRSIRRIGVVFSAPFVASGIKGNPSEAVEAIQRWKDAINRVNCHAFAWTLPAEGWNMECDGWLHPGVAILVSEASS